MEEQESDTFSLREAAEYAHVKPQAIYVAFRRKKIPAEKNGKKWIVKRSDLDVYRENKYNRDLYKSGGELIFDPEKGHFSVVHVAKVISHITGRRLSVQHLYYLIRKGRLTAFKKGGHFVIKKEDALELLEKEKTLGKMRMT